MTNTWHMLATVCRITLFSTRLLRKAFEVFCNKGIAGTSSAELLARFGDNILKKGGTEKLSAEAIEEILGKVVKLHVSDKDLFADFYRYSGLENQMGLDWTRCYKIIGGNMKEYEGWKYI